MVLTTNKEPKNLKCVKFGMYYDMRRCIGNEEVGWKKENKEKHKGEGHEMWEGMM